MESLTRVEVSATYLENTSSGAVIDPRGLTNDRLSLASHDGQLSGVGSLSATSSHHASVSFPRVGHVSRPATTAVGFVRVALFSPRIRATNSSMRGFRMLSTGQIASMSSKISSLPILVLNGRLDGIFRSFMTASARLEGTVSASSSLSLSSSSSSSSCGMSAGLNRLPGLARGA